MSKARNNKSLAQRVHAQLRRLGLAYTADNPDGECAVDQDENCQPLEPGVVRIFDDRASVLVRGGLMLDRLQKIEAGSGAYDAYTLVVGECRIDQEPKPGPVDLASAKGKHCLIDFGVGIECRFTAGGKEVALLGQGMLGVSAELRLADGSTAWAVLLLDAESAGEHCGTLVWLPSGEMADQQTKGFRAKLGRTKEQIFPYAYRYNAPVPTEDIHVRKDGWSREPAGKAGA